MHSVFFNGRETIRYDQRTSTESLHDGNAYDFVVRKGSGIPQNNTIWIIEPPPTMHAQARDRVPQHVGSRREVPFVRERYRAESRVPDDN